MAHVTHHNPQTRRWQDWANMALGALLAASPWLLGFTGLDGATLNAVIVGLLVFALSALALTLLDRWEAYISGMLGLWAAVSPWLIGFVAYEAAVATHVVIGVAVVTIAAYEVWQAEKPGAA
jgi:hypothetical protein